MYNYTDLLINEIQLANELSSILEDEIACLKDNKIEMLGELAKQKDSIVQRIAQLEEERSTTPFDDKDEEILALQQELATSVALCAKQNAQNGAVIMLAQQKINQRLNCLFGEQNVVSLYSAKGLCEQNILRNHNDI
jgi:flagellar biosynthesis/type III secretory pathway chaperone